ncbi:hypothetical protein F511_46195 [Dorcoceras hygrometricum]|uniref:Uncharacterized protein n=1 Tax=Dorcoceras hygrometricum TaxID=472368 RepID=A0A2Z7A1J6_9LAMI|nr:hypothetical protein F511_46195 [Dorcoceras hygrometricum]
MRAQDCALAAQLQQRLAETCRSSAQMIATLADAFSRLDAPPVGRCPEKRRAADGLLSRVDCALGGWMAAPLRAVPRERESSLATRSLCMVAGRIDTCGALVDTLVRAVRATLLAALCAAAAIFMVVAPAAAPAMLRRCSGEFPAMS